MNKSVKILVIDEVHLDETSLLSNADKSLNIEIITNWGLGTKADKNPSLLIHSVKEIDPIIMIIGGSHVLGDPKTAEKVFNAGPSLCFLIRAGVGIDHIAKKEATDAGIQIFNEPFGNNESTAEWALRMILASLDGDHPSSSSRMRSLDHIFTVPPREYNQSLKFRLLKRNHPRAIEERLHQHMDRLLDQNNFNRIDQLNNKTIGIMGLGNIGKIVLKKLHKLNQIDDISINIAATTTNLDEQTSQLAKACNCRIIESAKELFQNADIITLHIPATDDNLHIISSHLLFDSSANTLVNTSRDQIINYPDIEKHLNNKKSFQFFSDFIPGGREEIISHEHVCFVDHLGGITETANKNVWSNVSRILNAIIAKINTSSPHYGGLSPALNEPPANGWRCDNVQN